MVQGYNEAIGSVTEVQGSGQIIHADGSTEPLIRGAEIYQGDRIETLDGGSANLTFTDESSFAVSSNSSLVIDEYVFDGGTEAGVQNFNMMKGMFVYTSGLIGRDDPDDVHINTPVGSIGIRGTIIAGDVDSGQITVVEGAIVLKDFNGQEVTLANQYETARFGSEGNGITHIGQINAADLIENFKGLSAVSAGLFSNIQDSINDGAEYNIPQQPQPQVMDIQSDAAISADEGAENDLEDGEGLDASDPHANTMDSSEVNNDERGLSGSNFDLMEKMRQEEIRLFDGSIEQKERLNKFFDAGLQSHNFENEDTYNSAQNSYFLTLQSGHFITYTPPLPSFFNAAEGQRWSYSFNRDFNFSAPEGLGIQYALSQETIDFLDNFVGRSNYSFTGQFGALNITFGDISIDQGVPITIGVDIVDSAGNVLDTISAHNYNISLYANNGANDYTVSGTYQTHHDYAWFFGSSGAENMNIGLSSQGGTLPSRSDDYNRVFLGAGDDHVTIHKGKGNLINTGDGNDTIHISSESTKNLINAGAGNDTIVLYNTDNTVLGGEGNDRFEIFLNGSANPFGNLTHTVIDGQGHSGTTVGDSLVLKNSGLLDFTLLNDNLIKNIETIDLTDAGSQTVKLGLSDVFNMTDTGNTLRIKGASNDSVELLGFTAGGPSGDYMAYTGLYMNNGVDQTIQVLVHTDIALTV